MSQITLQQTIALAKTQHQAGQLHEAEQLYRQILAAQPAHPEAMQLLGLIAHQGGRNDIAIELIGRALELRPHYAEAWSNLAVALKESGRFVEAIAASQKAIAINPTMAESYINLGNSLRENGQLDEAILAFQQALAVRPDYAFAHNNLGNVLRDKGQIEQALACYRRAIAADPGHADAHNGLGNALQDIGKLTEAVAEFRQAINLRPDFAEAISNLGGALAEEGELDEGMLASRRAIELRPNNPDAYQNLGNALTNAGRLDEAITAYRQSIVQRPNHPDVHSILILAQQLHPAYDARAIAEEQARWNANFAEPLAKFHRPHTNDRNPDRRLKIGYVSPDFRQHVVGQNLLPLFAQHDHREVEIICYSGVVVPDSRTAEFQRYADRWRNTVGMPDERLAEQIREDQIDVLVDLSLHTAHNRLLAFARKPAPVQATFAGYPGSTGLTAIDYRISDPYLDPPGMDDSVYSEKTIRLPRSFWCYDPLETRDIEVNPLPAKTAGTITFGCLNNFCKINDEVLAVWGRVMARVEKSRLLLLASPGKHREHVTERLSSEGIDPARVEFLPRQSRRAYLQLYHRIDVELDTFPYGGHTTSLDSLWMGVPMVTLVGQRVLARAGWCQLSNLGLSDLAGQTAGDFVRFAVELANDLPRLEILRATLRQRLERSPLMDAAAFARDIESAYRQIWRDWCLNKGADPPYSHPK